MSVFAEPVTGVEQEEGTTFRPKFDSDGLVTAVACDAISGEVLMLAFMNTDALRLTLETGKAHYWSRSRKAIWLKGETSGNVQQVKEIRTDCDQDAVVMKVSVEGEDASCHTGRVSCFYREVHLTDGEFRLRPETRARVFDPKDVYHK